MNQFLTSEPDSFGTVPVPGQDRDRIEAEVLNVLAGGGGGEGFNVEGIVDDLEEQIDLDGCTIGQMIGSDIFWEILDAHDVSEDEPEETGTESETDEADSLSERLMAIEGILSGHNDMRASSPGDAFQCTGEGCLFELAVTTSDEQARILHDLHRAGLIHALYQN